MMAAAHRHALSRRSACASRTRRFEGVRRRILSRKNRYSTHARVAIIVLVGPLAGVAAVSVPSVAFAQAPAPQTRWQAFVLAQPTTFPSHPPPECPRPPGDCESYVAVFQNNGAQASNGEEIVVRDVLPAGVVPVAISATEGLHCEEPLSTHLRCSSTDLVPAGGRLALRIYVSLEPTASGVLRNAVIIQGGGAGGSNVARSENGIGAPTSFEVADFGMEVKNVQGSEDTRAGDHPYAVTTNLYFATKQRGAEYVPVEQVKDVRVDLPRGMVGDPQAIPQCAESALVLSESLSDCPPDSQVGTVVIDQATGANGFAINSTSDYGERERTQFITWYPSRVTPPSLAFRTVTIQSSCTRQCYRSAATACRSLSRA
jgi:uncharacterized repeat protein (TIGR01451 family)